jgi:hypothetical protein
LNVDVTPKAEEKSFLHPSPVQITKSGAWVRAQFLIFGNRMLFAANIAAITSGKTNGPFLKLI